MARHATEQGSTLAAATVVDLPTFGRLRTALGRLEFLYYRLFLKKHHAGVVLERVCDAPLVVVPGVLNPRLMRAGEFFASQLGAQLQDRNAEVLDMGTGSGVLAVIAARYARRVVAVDISPAAVRCARINALLNEVDDRIEILEGDLFAPLGERRFDVILFNQPFFKGVPQDDADRAWRSMDVLERFAAELRQHLAPAGFAMMMLTSVGGASELMSELRRYGFELTAVAKREWINEKMILVKLT